MVRWTALNAKKSRAGTERRRLALVDVNVPPNKEAEDGTTNKAKKKASKRPSVVVSPTLDEDVEAIKDTLRRMPRPKVMMPPPPPPAKKMKMEEEQDEEVVVESQPQVNDCIWCKKI